jgi:hypothetical protein
VSQCDNNSSTMSWQILHLKQCIKHMLTHYETERQRSVNNIWFCILGSQGFTQINDLITELLTACTAKNTTYSRKHTDSKIINVAHARTWKNRLLAVEYLILVIYNSWTANTWALSKSTDGHAGRHCDNLPNSYRLGDFHQTVPEFTVRWYIIMWDSEYLHS